MADCDATMPVLDREARDILDRAMVARLASLSSGGRDVQRRYTRGDAREYVLTPRGLWNFLSHARQWRPIVAHLRGATACVIDVIPAPRPR